jgi:hypothetical protein
MKRSTRIPRRRSGCLALCLATCLGPAAPAVAQEFQPHPQPRVTAEDYARYAEEVRQSFGSTAQVVKEDKVIVFSDMRTRTFYVFTTKDHPAHPAWITRQMVEEDGQVRVRQIGYFAGSEEAFARMFRDYEQRNTKLMEDVARRNR